MAVKISFADLSHTGQMVAANIFPLGIAYVASYAKQELKDEIDCKIFKYPDDFSNYLDTTMPRIACFSNFSWNLKLGHEYARRIKQCSLEVITVFGGPNFPDTAEEQQEFLINYPAIDCYLEFEGELNFVKLFRALKKVDFDWERFKDDRMAVPNIRYLVGEEMVASALVPKIDDVNIVPSPYECGMMDKFFDDILISAIQTTRGCPFKCAFCWEGGSYFKKASRFCHERFKRELRYIRERVNVPDLQITDANFGMFKQDVDTALEIKRTQKKSGWPSTVITATAKSNKERTLKIVKILGASLPATAAVQSTDDDVLKNIGRKNVSQDALVAYAREIENQGGQSEAEIILCLEGDTKEKHFRTVSDMLDADMKFIRLYQFMMIPGTLSSNRERRKKFGFLTKYRVLPRCFGTYSFRGGGFPAAEIEEICIANKTMPYEDYQTCRDLDLTVEIFNNDSILADLIHFLRRWDVRRSEFIRRIHQTSVNHPVFGKIYIDFRNEEKKNLVDSREALEEFTERPGTIERYIDGEYGVNEIYKYRAIAVFHHIESLHEIAYQIARGVLMEKDSLDDGVENYLSELCEFSLMRKSDCLNAKVNGIRKFHFNFKQLMDGHFAIDPFDTYMSEGINIGVYHSEEQIDLIKSYNKQYGTGLIGLGRILIRANMDRLYRRARVLDMNRG